MKNDIFSGAFPKHTPYTPSHYLETANFWKGQVYIKRVLLLYWGLQELVGRGDRSCVMVAQRCIKNTLESQECLA